MKLHHPQLAAFLFITVIFGAADLSAANVDAIDLRGTLSNEIALNTAARSTQKWESILQVTAEYPINNNLRLFGTGRWQWEHRDLLEPGTPSQNTTSHFNRRQFVGEKNTISLREFFIDGYADELFFRVGKQALVWGQADGLQVLDVINPFNFREFILDDIEDRRQPLWSATMDVPLKNWTAQFLWVPDQSFHQGPSIESGALFARNANAALAHPPPGYTQSHQQVDKPNRVVGDSDIGMRFSAFIAGWDLSLNYLYHYDNHIALAHHVEDGEIQLQPTFQRSHLIGGSFSNAFGDVTVRGEFAYSTERLFALQGLSLEALLESRGLLNSDEISTVIGIDFNGLSKTLISGQFFLSALKENHPHLAREQYESRVSLLFRRDFLNTTLTSELLGIHSTNAGDGLVQAKLNYALSSAYTLITGIDIFYGGQSGLFGRFHDLDRVTLGLEISF